MTIRPETPGDHEAVRTLVADAFGRPDEADLVDRLRGTPRYLALVSIDGAAGGGAVIGYVAFSPVTLDPPAAVDVRGLGPMAIAPGRQRRGIGAALVHFGLLACRRDGAEAVVVLGHPEYYPRFGFAPAPPRGLTCVYDAPPEAFMALALRPGALDGVRGVVRYHPAFGG